MAKTPDRDPDCPEYEQAPGLDLPGAEGLVQVLSESLFDAVTGQQYQVERGKSALAYYAKYFEIEHFLASGLDLSPYMVRVCKHGDSHDPTLYVYCAPERSLILVHELRAFKFYVAKYRPYLLCIPSREVVLQALFLYCIGYLRDSFIRFMKWRISKPKPPRPEYLKKKRKLLWQVEIDYNMMRTTDLHEWPNRVTAENVEPLLKIARQRQENLATKHFEEANPDIPEDRAL